MITTINHHQDNWVGEVVVRVPSGGNSVATGRHGGRGRKLRGSFHKNEQKAESSHHQPQEQSRENELEAGSVWNPSKPNDACPSEVFTSILRLSVPHKPIGDFPIETL